MKKLLKYSFALVFWLFLIPTDLKATHFIGGEISYECLNPTIGSYQFTVKLYRDCYTGVPPFDDPIYVSIYDSLGNLFTQLYMNLPPSDTLDNTTYNTCLSSPNNICVEEAVYQQTYILPPGKYYFTYYRCCRNQDILNILDPTSIGWSFFTVIPDASLAQCNNSAIFNSYPPTIICKDKAFAYDHSATDPDGDSLVYSLCAVTEYNTSVWGITPNPSGPPDSIFDVTYLPPYSGLYPIEALADPFTIDPVTGLLTGTPTSYGRYVVGVCVSEYRNGELLTINKRDFQFNVDSCLNIPKSDFGVDTTSECVNGPIYFTPLVDSNAISFLWDFGDGSTSTTANPTHSYSNMGTYSVTLIIEYPNGCLDTVTAPNLIMVDDCIWSGIKLERNRSKTGLSISPNPNTGMFTIVDPLVMHPTIEHISIYHIDGSLVYKLNNLILLNGSVEINLGNVKPGIYFLKAKLGEEILVRKVIVL